MNEVAVKLIEEFPNYTIDTDGNIRTGEIWSHL